MTKWPSLLRITVKNESHGTLPMKTDGPALNALIVPSETKVTVGMEEDDLNVDALLERVFEESDKRGNDNEVKQKDGASGGGPGGRRVAG